jgi:hypothetical protein
MVIPRSRSALSLSKTQAYLKEPLPSSAASCGASCQRTAHGLNAGRGGGVVRAVAILGSVGGDVRAQRRSAEPRRTPPKNCSSNRPARR